MTLLETACNIVVPDGGDPWHRLRHDDFSDCPLDELESLQLQGTIRALMFSNPHLRPTAGQIAEHPIVSAARTLGQPAIVAEEDTFMSQVLAAASDDHDESLGDARDGTNIFRLPLTPPESSTGLYQELSETEMQNRYDNVSPQKIVSH